MGGLRSRTKRSLKIYSDLWRYTKRLKRIWKGEGDVGERGEFKEGKRGDVDVDRYLDPRGLSFYTFAFVVLHRARVSADLGPYIGRVRVYVNWAMCAV